MAGCVEMATCSHSRLPWLQFPVRSRHRTVDLPILRTRDNGSPNNAHVRNLHFCIDSNVDEIRRTQTDETKDETTTHPGTRGRKARPSRRWRRRPSVVIDDASPLRVGCRRCGLVRRSGSEDVSRRLWPCSDGCSRGSAGPGRAKRKQVSGHRTEVWRRWSPWQQVGVVGRLT
jgi:hypothetical protein